MKFQHRGSQPSTPHLSPTFPENIEHLLAGRVRSKPPSTGNHVGLPIYILDFSNGTNSYSSSNGSSTSSSLPESRRKYDCVIAFRTNYCCPSAMWPQPLLHGMRQQDLCKENAIMSSLPDSCYSGNPNSLLTIYIYINTISLYGLVKAWV